ncbi:MAG: hypothetical protein IKP88_10825 [Lachnospiraceae bacterium]|nr:hypothetical protein [Lachnospiraceae bacterium]
MKKITMGIISLGLSAALIITGIKTASEVWAEDTENGVATVTTGELEVNTGDPITDGTEQIGKDASSLINSLLSSESDSDSSKTVKDETVYVISDANGNIQKVIVSDWIKNNLKDTTINDVSSLKDIINVKGDETFSQNGTNCAWTANGSDISYQGTSDDKLPVNVRVRYFLDGKEMTPDEIKGKSGHTVIRFEYENTTRKTVNINGKEEEMQIPFAVISGVILDDDRFSEIKASNARLLNDGSRTVVVGIAFPGLQDSLKIDREKFTIPESIEIEADVKDFSLGMTVTAATDEIFEKISSLDISSLDNVSESMGQLTDAMKQLTDGSGALSEGLAELLAKSGDLEDGIVKLANGSLDLKNGIKAADDGVGKLKSGAEQLSDGAGKLEAGAGQLYDGLGQLEAGAGQLKTGTEQLESGAGLLDAGIGQLKTGLDTLAGNNDNLMKGALDVFNAMLGTASNQLKEAGAEIPALTVDNYSQVLDGVILKLNQAAEGYKKADPATSAVYAAKAKAAAELKASLDGYNTFYQGLGAYTAGVAKSAEGVATIKAGSESLKNGTTELKSGVDGIKNGASELKTGSATLKDGLGSLKTGSDELKKGTEDLKAGTEQIYNGSGALNDGINLLKDNMPALKDGITQLHDGSVQLSDGIKEFNEKAIKKLVEAIEGDLEGFVSRMEALGGLAKEYNNYSGIADGMAGQVKFIYRTEEIK